MHDECKLIYNHNSLNFLIFICRSHSFHEILDQDDNSKYEIHVISYLNHVEFVLYLSDLRHSLLCSTTSGISWAWHTNKSSNGGVADAKGTIPFPLSSLCEILYIIVLDEHNDTVNNLYFTVSGNGKCGWQLASCNDYRTPHTEIALSLENSIVLYSLSLFT